jgi:hypothetical protein
MSRRLPQNESGPKGARKAGRHHRTYGYRGYGSGLGRGTDSYGGTVHWGSGFGGVGVAGGYVGDPLPRAGFFDAEAWERGPYFGFGSREPSHEDGPGTSATR